MGYSIDRSKAVFPVLVLLFVALWFILRGDLFYALPWVILLLCFSVLLALRLPRLGKRELILVLFVRLFDLRLFDFVGFLFLLVCGKRCSLWLWHSLDFSLLFFFLSYKQCRSRAIGFFKPTDINLHCLQRKGITGFCRTMVKIETDEHQGGFRESLL